MIAKYLILVALLLQIPVTHVQAAPNPNLTIRVLEDLRKPYTPPEFPDMTSNYKKMVEEKERIAEEKRLADLKAAQDAEIARQQQVRTQQASVVPTPPKMPQAQVGGGAGYIIAGSNCVECVRRLTGRSQNGNAGTWRASTSTPYVGAIMIFYGGEQGASSLGHVAVVVGINGDGTINVAHCNWQGQTRFRSTGKFW